MCLRCLRPILLTASDQLLAGILAKSDPEMLDNGSLKSQTRWANSQLLTSDVHVTKPLLAHLTSKESTLSQERTDSYVPRFVLGRSDIVKDTQTEKAVALSNRSETAARVTRVHAK